MSREEACEIEVRVRYAETDQMGRAHHSHHLVWCEAARTAWLRRRGASYADLERRGVHLPVSRGGVRRLPEEIRGWLGGSPRATA